MKEYLILETSDNQYHSRPQEVTRSAYKIRVHIEMIPCDDTPTSTPVKELDGSLSLVLSEADAISIDACEQALLQTPYPTLRETLSTHLSELSKKTPLNGHARDC